jgi:sulfopropanediol 3-dehydrogenase
MRPPVPIEVTWVKEALPEDPADTTSVEATVRRIISDVSANGVAAIRRYSRELDNWDPPKFRVSRQEIDRAYDTVGSDTVAEITFVHERVQAFAQKQLESLRPLEAEFGDGIVLGHRLVPVSQVGCYVPGGYYPLIASVHMQVTTARVAGVERIVCCAPPRDGAIWPATLVAMDICGASEIYSLGGVQALAAMAFGFEEMKPVDLISGPGNQYVAEAKRQLFGTVGIDLPAGPTEIMVIADATADPKIVAADLLGQAEHGPNSPAHLVTTSMDLAEAVLTEIDRQLPILPTAEILKQSWPDYGAIALVGSDEAMVAYADWYAPEHLEVITADPDWFAARLRNYGSLFLGEEATVAHSDKASGTNHTLPTGRAARYTGGLWVGKYIKVLTYQQMTRQGSSYIGDRAAAMARLEGMYAHAASCDVRAEKYA